MLEPQASSSQLSLSLREAVSTLERSACLVDLADDHQGGAAGRLAAAARGDESPGLLAVDSRKVTRGGIFIAFKGVHADGHDHIAAALAKGARLIVVEDPARLPPRHRDDDAAARFVVCRDGRAAWAHLAARASGNPEKSLKLVAATGTNGKTSTSWMCGELLRASGVGCLTIGTLGAGFDDALPETTGYTTPDPDKLYPLLAAAHARRLPSCVMEASSHALMQGKLAPLTFEAGAFTSFSRDHLDYHETMEAYWAAKERLFLEHVAPGGLCAISDSLPRPPAVAKDSQACAYGFAAEAFASHWRLPRALQISEARVEAARTFVVLRDGSTTLSGSVPYLGKLALENFCAALLLAHGVLGTYPDPASWSKIRQVPGRLERVDSGGTNEPCIIVDYAHTPDALAKTLAMLRESCRGKLIVVFGCGGDRDRGKRPQMGAAAEALADRVVVTSDNPRSEDPAAIMAEIAAGLRDPKGALFEQDRKAAIELAISEAAKDDTVLIAGKGHEDYQIIGTTSLSFDDRAVARTALMARTT